MASESPAVRAARPTYRSPQHKLVVFFAQSRDQWKAKCRRAKARLKQLKKQGQRGVARQHRFRERERLLRQDVSRLQAENRRLTAALAAWGKKRAVSKARDGSYCQRLPTTLVITSSPEA